MDEDISIRNPIDDGPVSYAIINGVAAISNNQPTACPPLHNTVDTDALNALASEIDDGKIHFDYAGYDITVESDRAVIISTD